MEPAEALREARTSARLSQNDLARRAGVPQSVISAYESGRRQPSLRVLQRLIAATGAELVLAVRHNDVPVGLPDTRLGRRLRRHRQRLLEIAARYGVTNVRVFGSVARGEDGDGSDIDLLVDLPARITLFTLARLQEELSDLLGVPVDLVPASGLKPHVRPAAERDAIPL